jgi:hypothetical protein
MCLYSFYLSLFLILQYALQIISLILTLLKCKILDQKIEKRLFLILIFFLRYISFQFLFLAYYRPFMVGVMTDADEGPIAAATDKQNRGFNLMYSQQPCLSG